ncbi:MAG: hypothetical protein HDR09_12880 [Lachnospiraceae bacterium]|nr:hypothetical protein [Lachnospiraceae bacterium]
MSIQEFITGGSISLFALLTVIQIVPVKVNPWSAIAKAFGRAINAEVLNELAEMKETQKETREKLEAHIEMDDERMADVHRTRILHFNNELLRDIEHTKEEFIEALADIDEYEQYCKDHPKYKNNRAVHAIANIKRVYDERLEKRDFLQ